MDLVGPYKTQSLCSSQTASTGMPWTEVFVCVSCCSLLLCVGFCCGGGQRENRVCVKVLPVAWAGCERRAAGTAVQFRRPLFAENG